MSNDNFKLILAKITNAVKNWYLVLWLQIITFKSIIAVSTIAIYRYPKILKEKAMNDKKG